MLSKKQIADLESVCNKNFNTILRKAQKDIAFYFAYFHSHKPYPKLSFENIYARVKDAMSGEYAEQECAERWGLTTRQAASIFIKKLGIDKIFHEKRKENRIKKMLEELIPAYEKYNGIAAHAAKDLKYKAGTINKYWRMAGLRAKCGTKLSFSEILTVIAAHEVFGGNSRRAAQGLPFSCSSFLKYWKVAGLKIRKPGAYL